MKPLVYKKASRRRRPARTVKPKMHITKGDTVKVISGDEKGHTGKVLRAIPAKGKVIVEGVNVVKRHRKARQQGEESQIVEFPAPIAASAVLGFRATRKPNVKHGVEIAACFGATCTCA